MNTRHIWIGASVIVALAGGLAAQSTSPPTSPPTSPSTSPATSRIQQTKDIVVTGCVQSADQPSSAPTGSARPGAAAGARPSISNAPKSASSSANRFMLTGAASGGGASAAKSDSSPVAGTYMLEGGTTELRQHLNHLVEITGHVSSSYSSSGSSSSSASGQRLNVLSVRMISASCAR